MEDLQKMAGGVGPQTIVFYRVVQHAPLGGDFSAACAVFSQE